MITHKNKVAAGLRALTANKMPAPLFFLYMEHDCVPLDDLFDISVFVVASPVQFDESNLTEHIMYVPVWGYNTREPRTHDEFMKVYCEAYCDAPEEE